MHSIHIRRFVGGRGTLDTWVAHAIDAARTIISGASHITIMVCENFFSRSQSSSLSAVR